ncbi:MAG: nuclear transport factor 2 family protein [Actinomycetota bacterium]|nr:nuclear transport factor 2 family protein [Actinomycetota bacterium]
MSKGARTPEELETLFEDAFVTGDPDSMAALFEDSALLVTGGNSGEARGSEAIARLTAAMLRLRLTYFADPKRVLQASDTALVLADGGINVVRRDADGVWRYAISLLEIDPTERNSR